MTRTVLYNYDKLLLFELHFRPIDYDFNSDAKLTRKERIEQTYLIISHQLE